MTQVYFLSFWIPALASAILLLVGFQTGLVTRRGLFVCFGIALLMQIVSDVLAPLWAVGLVLQSALAVYLVIKMKLG